MQHRMQPLRLKPHRPPLLLQLQPLQPHLSRQRNQLHLWRLSPQQRQ
jgi:hypothetical protein